MPFRLSVTLPVCLLALLPRAVSAQTIHVGDEAALRSAISSAAAGSTIVLDTNISLTADLPTVSSSVTIDGAGHTLSGSNQFRGFFIEGYDPASPGNNLLATVIIQNLTIANTVATGGAGGSGVAGGGGGAGLGGAIFVGDFGAVTVSNVNILLSSAVGGAGGFSNATATGGGGGGGLGGSGGAAVAGGAGGGGGVGGSGAGGTTLANGGSGTLTGSLPGGDSGPVGTIGGANGGGGGGGTFGGAGGGNLGDFAGGGSGGTGGFGGGGGGQMPAFVSATFAGFGGFGGGGGGGIDGPGCGGAYGGGGGATPAAGFGGCGGQFAGNGADGTTGRGGGGGAALGGAIFVMGGGTFNIAGAFAINGSSVTGGAAGDGAQSGSAYGSGLYLGGNGVLAFNQAAGQTATITNDIADEQGVIGPFGCIDCAPPGRWGVDKQGNGTLVLTGNNIYSAGTVVEGGTLQINGSQNIGGIGGGSVLLMNGTTLDVRGTSTFFMPLFLDGTPAMSIARGQQATWSGTILDGDTPGTMTVTGGGTLTLTDATNSYTGGTIVRGSSTVEISADGALGGPAGAVTLGDSGSGGTLRFLTGSAFTTNRNYFLGFGGGTFDTQGSANVAIGTSITGSGALTKAGTGTLTLTSANSYTGGTFVNQGTLRTSIANAFDSLGSMTVSTGGALDLNSFSQTVGSLSGGGTVALGSATLTTGGNNASTLFSGSITGTGSIVKVGGGLFALTGTNSYTGGTTVNGGTLLGSTSSLQGAINNNSLVVIAQNTSGTFAGTMSGTGRLAYIGSGILSLNAGNSYSGGTSVSGGGTISIGADSALGASGGAVLLGDATTSGTLSFRTGSIFSNNRPFIFGAGGAILDTAGTSSITLNGGLSGAGGFTKIGTGTLTLGGPATFTGPASILAGSLRAGAVNVLDANAPLLLAPGTSLDLGGFNQTVASLSGNGSLALGAGTLTTGGDGSSSTYAGAISGSGGLVKVGGGTLSLTGANSYSGGTTVSGGALLGNTASLQGNIVNNALVIFDQTPDATYGGSMSGSGTLAKLGAGVLTLTGTNTYSGGTIIDGGSVIGTANSLQGTIINNASMTLGGNTDATFHGILAGTGGITKTGTGTLTLGGTNPMTGDFNLNQGGLSLSGQFGGSVNVASGASLHASGFIAGPLSLAGSLFVVSAPVTAQQSSSEARDGYASAPSERLTIPPSLVVGGNLTSTPGSTIDFTIGPGANPTVFVGGAATLNGTHFSITAPSIGTARSASFLAMTATGLTMQNANVSTGDPTVVPVLKQTTNSLFVTLLNLNIPLASVTGGGNGASVAKVLDKLKFGATGDRAFVIDELTALNDGQLNGALDQIAGQIHASAVQTTVIDTDGFFELVRDQVQAREIEEHAQVHFWTNFNCQHANYKGANGVSGGDANVCGGGGGADRGLGDHWLLGGGGGFGGGTLGLGGFGSTDYHAPRAFGYAGWKPKTFGIRFGGSAAKSSYKTQRPIQFAATLPADFGGQLLDSGVDRQAESHQDGTSSDQWSELHDSRKVGSYTYEGTVSIRHARFTRNGWDESGAQSLSLASASQTLTLNETDIRLHGFRRTGTFRPFFDAFYRRQLTEGATVTDLNFADAPNSTFSVEGIPVPGNTYSGRAGATMKLRLGQLTFEYSFLHSPNESRHGFGLHFRFS